MPICEAHEGAKMQRTQVSSTAIKSVGYDPARLILEIEFTTGNIYQYRGVPPATHAVLMGESSHGTYFNTRIKGHFPEQKVQVRRPSQREPGCVSPFPPPHLASQVVGHGQVFHVD